MDNSYFNGFGNMGNQQQSTTYRQGKQAQYTEPEKELMDLLRKKSNFSIVPTDEERAYAACPHRHNKKDLLTVDHADASKVRCQQCGASFRILSEEDIPNLNESIEFVIDALQTIKTLHKDINTSILTNFMIMIVTLRKVPRLLQISLDFYRDFKGGEGAENITNTYNMNPIDTLQSIISGNNGIGQGQQPNGFNGYNGDPTYPYQQQESAFYASNQQPYGQQQQQSQQNTEMDELKSTVSELAGIVKNMALKDSDGAAPTSTKAFNK